MLDTTPIKELQRRHLRYLGSLFIMYLRCQALKVKVSKTESRGLSSPCHFKWNSNGLECNAGYNSYPGGLVCSTLVASV